MAIEHQNRIPVCIRTLICIVRVFATEVICERDRHPFGGLRVEPVSGNLKSSVVKATRGKEPNTPHDYIICSEIPDCVSGLSIWHVSPTHTSFHYSSTNWTLAISLHIALHPCSSSCGSQYHTNYFDIQISAFVSSSTMLVSKQMLCRFARKSHLRMPHPRCKAAVSAIAPHAIITSAAATHQEETAPCW